MVKMVVVVEEEMVMVVENVTVRASLYRPAVPYNNGEDSDGSVMALLHGVGDSESVSILAVMHDECERSARGKKEGADHVTRVQVTDESDIGRNQNHLYVINIGDLFLDRFEDSVSLQSIVKSYCP